MVIDELVKAVLSELRQITKTETVIGKPFQVGKTTLVPVSKISVGFAAGGGKKNAKNGQGEATGGGATIEPLAFFVIKEDKVELVTMDKEDMGLGKVIDLVPQIIEKVKDMKEKRGKTVKKEKKEDK